MSCAPHCVNFTFESRAVCVIVYCILANLGGYIMQQIRDALTTLHIWEF